MNKKSLIAFLLFLMWANFATSQEIDSESGKSYYYYDNEKREVKEIYHHKRMIKFGIRAERPGEYYDTTVYVKSGPYLRYYMGGRLECSGFYRDDRKDSLWKYYNAEGVLLRTEMYRNGEIVK